MFQQLETAVMAKGNVEVWLGDLLNQAMNSLHAVIRDAYHAINDGGFNLMNFLGQFASQVPSRFLSVFSLCITHLPVPRCVIHLLCEILLLFHCMNCCKYCSFRE